MVAIELLLMIFCDVLGMGRTSVASRLSLIFQYFYTKFGANNFDSINNEDSEYHTLIVTPRLPRHNIGRFAPLAHDFVLAT